MKLNHLPYKTQMLLSVSGLKLGFSPEEIRANLAALYDDGLITHLNAPKLTRAGKAAVKMILDAAAEEA